MRRNLTLTGVAMIMSVVLAGCRGGQDSPSASDAAGSSAGTGPSGDATSSFNEADIAFASDMITHHRQAVDMAGLADGRASAPEVVDLAAQIAAAQQSEIDLMSGWLDSWGASAPEDMSGMDMSGSMPGMMSMADMEELAAASGSAFDRQFLTMMIAHHQGAIEMATAEIRDGHNPAAIALANDVITAQTAEIATMKDLLAE